jgi:hypothetical protein
MDKIIVICATGRSGSTTLQRIINSIPFSNICGENMGAVNSLLEFYKRLKISTKEFIPGHLKPVSFDQLIDKKIKPSWYNSYNLDEIVKMIQILIMKLFKKNNTTTIWGFKEIRYDGISGNHIEYMNEFIELFPSVKIIIHIRNNIIQQAKSNWLAKDKNAIVYLKKNNKKLTDFYNKNKKNCFLSTFENMFNLDNINNIFKFIECEKYFNNEKINLILNDNITDL